MKNAVIFLMGSCFISYTSALKAQEKVTGKDPVKNIESVNVSGKQNLDALTVPRKTLDFIQSGTLGET